MGTQSTWGVHSSTKRLYVEAENSASHKSV